MAHHIHLQIYPNAHIKYIRYVIREPQFNYINYNGQLDFHQSDIATDVHACASQKSTAKADKQTHKMCLQSA